MWRFLNHFWLRKSLEHVGAPVNIVCSEAVAKIEVETAGEGEVEIELQAVLGRRDPGHRDARRTHDGSAPGSEFRF